MAWKSFTKFMKSTSMTKAPAVFPPAVSTVTRASIHACKQDTTEPSSAIYVKEVDMLALCRSAEESFRRHSFDADVSPVCVDQGVRASTEWAFEVLRPDTGYLASLTQLQRVQCQPDDVLIQPRVNIYNTPKATPSVDTFGQSVADHDVSDALVQPGSGDIIKASRFANTFGYSMADNKASDIPVRPKAPRKFYGIPVTSPSDDSFQYSVADRHDSNVVTRPKTGYYDIPRTSPSEESFGYPVADHGPSMWTADALPSFHMFSPEQGNVNNDVARGDRVPQSAVRFDRDHALPQAVEPIRMLAIPVRKIVEPIGILVKPVVVSVPATPTVDLPKPSIPVIQPRPLVSIQDFTFKKSLGAGAYGYVYLVEHCEVKTMHAVKLVKKKRVKSFHSKAVILDEQKILKKLAGVNSPWFLHLEASFHDTHNFYFITEFMSGGDLDSELEKCEYKFPGDRVRFYMAELSYAVDFLHSLRIMHRDIKPHNIFIDAMGHLVLGDFGLARLFTKEEKQVASIEYVSAKNTTQAKSGGIRGQDFTSSPCGTPSYCAPELLDYKPYYSYPADVWSLGVVMFQMLYGHLPFGEDANDLDGLRWALIHDPVKIPKMPPVDDKTEDVLEKMLKKRPAERIGLQTLMGHDYFHGINWQKLANRKDKVEWNETVPAKKPEKAVGNKLVNVVLPQLGDIYLAANDPHPDFGFIAPKMEKQLHKLRKGDQLTRMKAAILGAKQFFSIRRPSGRRTQTPSKDSKPLSSKVARGPSDASIPLPTDKPQASRREPTPAPPPTWTLWGRTLRCKVSKLWSAGSRTLAPGTTVCGSQPPKSPTDSLAPNASGDPPLSSALLSRADSWTKKMGAFGWTRTLLAKLSWLPSIKARRTSPEPTFQLVT